MWLQCVNKITGPRDFAFTTTVHSIQVAWAFMSSKVFRDSDTEGHDQLWMTAILPQAKLMSEQSSFCEASGSILPGSYMCKEHKTIVGETNWKKAEDLKRTSLN